MKRRFVPATLTAGVWFSKAALADPFFWSTGTPDRLLGALSQPAAAGHLETEIADDFILSETTDLAQATIIGLIATGTSLASIGNVYHVFPKDSTDPASLNVPSRVNSAADAEIDAATRAMEPGTLAFQAREERP